MIQSAFAPPILSSFSGDVADANSFLVVRVRSGEEAQLAATLSQQGYEFRLYGQPSPSKTDGFSARAITTTADEPSTPLEHLLTLLADDDRKSQRPALLDRLDHDDLVIFRSRREVLVRERPIELTKTQFDILWLLARHPGVVFSRNQIVKLCKGTNYLVNSRSVDVNVVGLRRRLGSAGVHIRTVRGVGYRFD